MDRAVSGGMRGGSAVRVRDDIVRSERECVVTGCHGTAMTSREIQDLGERLMRLARQETAVSLWNGKAGKSQPHQ